MDMAVAELALRGHRETERVGSGGLVRLRTDGKREIGRLEGFTFSHWFGENRKYESESANQEALWCDVIQRQPMAASNKITRLDCFVLFKHFKSCLL